MDCVERKSVPTEFKVDIDTRTVKGYGSVFGNIDKGGDIMMSGAFQKSIDARMPRNVKYFDRHQRGIGMFTVLKEDSTGLYFEAKISDTTFGTDHLVLVKDGVINEASVGFRTIKQLFDEANLFKGWPVRELHEVDLLEVSGVEFGMNDQTSVSAKAMEAFLSGDGFSKILRQIVQEETKSALMELKEVFNSDSRSVLAACEKINSAIPVVDTKPEAAVTSSEDIIAQKCKTLADLARSL